MDRTTRSTYYVLEREEAEEIWREMKSSWIASLKVDVGRGENFGKVNLCQQVPGKTLSTPPRNETTLQQHDKLIHMVVIYGPQYLKPSLYHLISNIKR